MFKETPFADAVSVCVGELDTNGVAVGVGRTVIDDGPPCEGDVLVDVAVDVDPVELAEAARSLFP